MDSWGGRVHAQDEHPELICQFYDSLAIQNQQATSLTNNPGQPCSSYAMDGGQANGREVNPRLLDRLGSLGENARARARLALQMGRQVGHARQDGRELV